MKKILFQSLVVFFLLLLAVPVEGSPVIRVEAYPDIPIAGVPWRLAFFVDHPVPDEVTIISPAFPPLLWLDRHFRAPRMTSAGLQTVLEFTLIPNRSGRFLIEPFTIRTPAGITETGYFVLDVQESNEHTISEKITPRVVWDGAAQTAVGEQAVLSLHVYGMDSSLPSREFFMPEVPQGAILSSLPLSEQDRIGGIVLRLLLIPLEGDFRLPQRTLQFENYVFEIPALHIRVTDRVAALNEDLLDNNIVDLPAAPSLYFQFPDFDFSVFDRSIMRPWRDQCKDILNTVRNLWDDGLYALALAELRRNERDHPAGVFFQPIRREAEEGLGFFNTENENRWRRFLFLTVSFLIIFIVIVFPVVCLLFITRKSKKAGRKFLFFRRTASLMCAVIIAVLVSLTIYRLADTRNIFRIAGNRFGVVTETSVRRLADYHGEELFFFREGQPVVVILNSGYWVYVRTNDIESRSGWIPAERVKFY